MAIYRGKNRLSVTILTDKEDDLNTELTEQEELLTDLESDVNALEDKPKSDIQYMIDQTNSCGNLFYTYSGTDLDFVKNLDTSGVTDMTHMFKECANITDLNLNFDTGNVADMTQMFMDCKSLINLNVSSFNTDNVTKMGSMFNGCSALTNLDLKNFNTSNVTTIGGMFSGCSNLINLDVSTFNTINLITIASAFNGCVKLTSLNLSNWVINKVSSMNATFKDCESLLYLDLAGFNMSFTSNLNKMFSGCKKLETINGVIDGLRCNFASSLNDIFYNCMNLKNVTLKNIKVSIKIGHSGNYGTLLTNESVINTIKELWDLTGSTSQTLTLSTDSKNNIANIYVKLITPTAEQIEADPYIERKKPCEVCESTDDGAMLITEYLISKNWSLA